MTRDDPKYWRIRAEETRMLAEQMSSLESQRAMLEIADSYEHQAVRAEQRLCDHEKSK